MGNEQAEQVLAELVIPSVVGFTLKNVSGAVGRLPQDEGNQLADAFILVSRELTNYTVEACMELLSSGDVRKRDIAAHALGVLGDRRAVGPLNELVVNDTDGGVRSAAAAALGLLRDPSSINPLISTLSYSMGEYPRYARLQAAVSLGELGDRSAVPPLIQQLGVETDFHTRESIVFALAQLGDASAGEALILSLGDVSAEVRRAAAKALGSLGVVDAIEPLEAHLNAPNSLDDVYGVLDAITTSLETLRAKALKECPVSGGGKAACGQADRVCAHHKMNTQLRDYLGGAPLSADRRAGAHNDLSTCGRPNAPSAR